MKLVMVLLVCVAIMATVQGWGLDAETYFETKTAYRKVRLTSEKERELKREGISIHDLDTYKHEGFTYFDEKVVTKIFNTNKALLDLIQG